MKIGFIQFQPFFGEKEKNIKRTVELIKKGAKADLMVLPELSNTGYLFEDIAELRKLAEEIPNGKTTKTWIDLAKETDTYIIAGICEKAAENEFYNSAVLIGPEGFIDVYRKVHLFDREKLFFKPGNDPFKVYDIGLAKVGILICFDWIFPEATRVLALQGAEIICHSANLVLPFAQKAMLTRSVENRVFTITANRTGEDVRPNSKLHFTGQSQITSPKMELLAQAAVDSEEVVSVEIDLALAQNKMVTSNNHIFIDRRPDLYEILLQNYPYK